MMTDFLDDMIAPSDIVISFKKATPLNRDEEGRDESKNLFTWQLHSVMTQKPSGPGPSCIRCSMEMF